MTFNSVRSSINRIWTAALVGSLTAGCAHQAPTVREPSNAEVEASQNSLLVQNFQNTAAAQAFVITTDPRGVRRAICQINVANRDTLVPSYLPLDRTGATETFGLPECRGDQVQQINDIAMASNRPQYAVAPVIAAAVGVCLVDFALSAALTMASNHVANRLADRKSARVRGVIVAGQSAGGLVIGALSAGAARMKSPALGLLGAGLLAVTCTGGGAAVGYLLVPPK